MLQKRAIQTSAGKQKDERGASARRVPAFAGRNTVKIARVPAMAPGSINARLKRAAKESFQNMGED